MSIIRRFFQPAQPCPHLGHICVTRTARHGRTICDACGAIFAEWQR
jgi:transcription initiation factor TFIIIB Brf1 subunit/transcription initiation factor TFIIB